MRRIPSCQSDCTDQFQSLMVRLGLTDRDRGLSDVTVSSMNTAILSMPLPLFAAIRSTQLQLPLFRSNEPIRLHYIVFRMTQIGMHLIPLLTGAIGPDGIPPASVIMLSMHCAFSQLLAKSKT